MRAWTWLGLLLVLVGCRAPQPGCTIENCGAMIEACRIEFSGGPESLAECTGFDRPERSILPEIHGYCVEACNARPGRGELASCVAGKANECNAARADGGFTAVDAVVQSCFDQNAKGPQRSCDDTCRAQQKECDTKCSGGDACDQCLRAGRSCAAVCTDAGWKPCLDCSAKCGLDSLACSDRCPREG